MLYTLSLVLKSQYIKPMAKSAHWRCRKTSSNKQASGKTGEIHLWLFDHVLHRINLRALREMRNYQ